MGDTVLSGMKAIVDYCASIGLPRTDASIIQLKREYNFPMQKILGIWESDKGLIVEWRKKYISGEITQNGNGAELKKAKSAKKSRNNR